VGEGRERLVGNRKNRKSFVPSGAALRKDQYVTRPEGHSGRGKKGKEK